MALKVITNSLVELKLRVTGAEPRVDNMEQLIARGQLTLTTGEETAPPASQESRKPRMVATYTRRTATSTEIIQIKKARTAEKIERQALNHWLLGFIFIIE